MDTADAARVTEAVTGAVADAVKRGESYSSLEDFLTDESVERMTEAVIEEAAKTLGLADADDTGVNEKKLDDSRVAALKDMAKESLTEQFRRDGELRDTAERIRQKRREGIAGKSYDYLNGIPVEYYGNSVLFPPEYGTMYSDGKRYPMVVAPYSEAPSINKELNLPNTQAHHLAQDAIYRDRISKAQGITMSVEGDAIREPNSQHGVEHNYYTTELEQYYKTGTKPTHREFAEIMMGGMMEIGVHPAVRNYALDRVIRQLVENGIDLEKEIDRFPGTQRFKKIKNIGGEKTDDGQS